MFESEEDSFTPDGWVNLWAKGLIGFHFKIVHPVIKEFHSWLLDGKTNQRIFLPLCGKSRDMPWLAEQGHQVVGLDCVEKAAKDFFEENRIQFTVSEIPGIDGGKLYKSSDGKINFYVCDFFKITSDIIGQFDAVWDMRGLFAIPGYEEKIKYVDQLKPLIKSGGRMLLDLAEPKLKIGETTPDWVKSLYELDVEKMFAWCSSIELAKTYDYENVKNYLMEDAINSEELAAFRHGCYGIVYKLIN
ncbi:probable thiopurine S-methyltransferase isoform X2 [Apostichopus japonicus]